MESQLHKSVLLEEVLSFIPKDVKNKKLTFVDMTLGRGGHSQRIIEKINSKDLEFYGFDRDQTALDFVENKFKDLVLSKNYIRSKFSEAVDILKERNVSGMDICLFDIGVSSPQFDNPERGFSYREDARLDMRMDQSQKLDAHYVVNTYPKDKLAKILFEYGNEKYANQIANTIDIERRDRSIDTTFDLVDIVKRSIPKKELFKEHHPAKKTFMAIRYEVNQEKDELVIGLEKAINFLNKNGILLIITFNSFEDGIVKQMFNKYSKEVFISKYLPMNNKEMEYEVLTRKPIVPKVDETEENPRSKPAKLRVIKKK